MDLCMHDFVSREELAERVRTYNELVLNYSKLVSGYLVHPVAYELHPDGSISPIETEERKAAFALINEYSQMVASSLGLTEAIGNTDSQK